MAQNAAQAALGTDRAAGHLIRHDCTGLDSSIHKKEDLSIAPAADSSGED